MWNSLSSSFLGLLWTISLQTAILAAAVWLIARRSAKAPASWRYMLWLVVLIKFLVPPIFLPYLSSQVPVVKTSIEAPVAAPTPVTSNPLTEKLAPAAVAGAYAQPEPKSKPILPALPIAAMITIVWLSGAALFGARFAIRYRLQSRLVAAAIPASDDLVALLAECAERLGMRRVPALNLSEKASGPMVVGLFRPRILLPTAVADSCGRSDVTSILLHELAHVKRWDLAGVWLEELVKTLFYFHPAVHLTVREVRKEREIACDELALATAPAKEYAAGYLSALRLGNSDVSVPVALAMAEPFEVETRRLKMMLRTHIPKLTRRSKLLLVALILLILPTYAGIRAMQIHGGYVLERTWGSFAPGRFLRLTSVAVDKTGNVYVADEWDHCVQKLDRFGRTLAKWRIPDSLPNWASLLGPASVAVDNNDNIYVAEGPRIFKLNGSGHIVANFSASGSENNEASGPVICVDARGCILVAASGALYKLDGKGRLLGQWSGLGQCPLGIAVDRSGVVYVADWNESNSRVTVFAPSGGVIRKWAAHRRQRDDFNMMSGIAIGSDGNVYLAEREGHMVQAFTARGEFIRQWAEKAVGPFNHFGPGAICADKEGSVYIADEYGCRVLKCDPYGKLTAEWGKESKPRGKFCWPTGVAVDRQRNVYVLDTSNVQVQKFDCDGAFLTAWNIVDRPDDLDCHDPATDIAVDASGNVYVFSSFGATIRKFDSHGRLLLQWGPKRYVPENHSYVPGKIFVDRSGNVFINEGECIVKLLPTGKLAKIYRIRQRASDILPGVCDCCVDRNGNLYVTDHYGFWIHKFDPTGKEVRTWGSWREGAHDAMHESAGYIAIDDNDYLYVTDDETSSVYKFSPSGRQLGKWGVPGTDEDYAGRSEPQGVAVDTAGSVYVVDRSASRVLKYSRFGVASLFRR